jgi:hypothetical protein
VPQTTRAPGVARWGVLALLICLGWLVSVQPVPLYDGIGFPDEPYRFLPARAGSAAAGPATVAKVTLKVAGGVNTGGLIANSAETGPQVSVYAPPRAFATTGNNPIELTATPVVPDPPLPKGTLDSNVYDLEFTSAGGQVKLVPAAQTPTITLRAVSIRDSLPVFEYRPASGQSWKEVRTRQVGRDIFNALATAPGQYALVQSGDSSPSGASSRGPLYAILGATLLLMLGVVVGVRVLGRRAAAQQ